VLRQTLASKNVQRDIKTECDAVRDSMQATINALRVELTSESQQSVSRNQTQWTRVSCTQKPRLPLLYWCLMCGLLMDGMQQLSADLQAQSNARMQHFVSLFQQTEARLAATEALIHEKLAELETIYEYTADPGFQEFNAQNKKPKHRLAVAARPLQPHPPLAASSVLSAGAAPAAAKPNPLYMHPQATAQPSFAPASASVPGYQSMLPAPTQK
jgi:hypothetical protein